MPTTGQGHQADYEEADKQFGAEFDILEDSIFLFTVFGAGNLLPFLQICNASVKCSPTRTSGGFVVIE